MYRIIPTMKYWFTFSTLVVVLCIAAYVMWGFNLGIDFTGGSSMQLHFANSQDRPTTDEFNSVLANAGIAEHHVQLAGETDAVLKLPHITNDQRQQILDAFKDRGVSEQNFSSIGPTLGEELQKKAVTAIILVMLAIVGYITYVFRTVSNGPVPSWVYGLGAIVALLHDVVIVVGIFIALGHFYNIQIDSLFVTALLTVLGFSVHDTIVVYDRIREGLKDRARKSFAEIVNSSINTTMARSLNTSLITLIVLFALYLFGGESTQNFVLALIIGIITGTYSSIFVASPVLLFGQKVLKR